MSDPNPTPEEPTPEEPSPDSTTLFFSSPPPPDAEPAQRGARPPAEKSLRRGPPLTQQVIGSVLVVAILEPDLNDESTVGPLRYALREQLEQTYPRLEVIDLGEVQYMSSRAVGVLLAHNQALGREGGKMRICRATPNVLALVKQMRLDMFIDVFDTVEEAVQEPWD
jgi:anti-anti-sigma factor